MIRSVVALDEGRAVPVAETHRPAVDRASRSRSGLGPVPGLAAAIRADGGLAFLRARLQDRLEERFGAPEAAAGGSEPAARYESAAASPEATADRIVGFALGLLGRYREGRPAGDAATMLGDFEREVRRGIAEGFDHARDALAGLDLLGGEVEANVDATWELVQRQLDEAFDRLNAARD